MPTIHPAVQANMNSIKYAMEGNRDAWLALYRDDAVVSDPVGKSPFDAAGDGHIGKEAIAAFYDTVIGPSNITLTPGLRCPSGDYTCAVPMTALNDLGNGLSVTINMIAVYEVDDAGLIKSMSAFWDYAEMEKQLADLGLA